MQRQNDDANGIFSGLLTVTVADCENIPFHQQEDRTILRLPVRMPDKILPVVVLELDGQPRGVRRAWWHWSGYPGKIRGYQSIS